MSEQERIMPKKLTPVVWASMSAEAKGAYHERNDLLWRVIRAIRPGSSGTVDEQAKQAIDQASVLLTRVDNLQESGRYLAEVRRELETKYAALRERVRDAEAAMDAMRQEAILAPDKQHDSAECSQSWGKINEIWAEYQRSKQ